MKLYKVSLDADFGDGDSRAVWTSRKSDIPTLKKELTDAAHLGAWPEPSVDEVAFHPTIQGILSMLNQFASRG